MYLASPARLGEAAQLALCGVALLAGLSLIAAAPSPEDKSFFVVFPPWTSQADAVGAATSAGASLLGPSPIHFVAEVWSDRAGYPDRVRAQGALIVLPSHMMVGCTRRLLRAARA